MKKSVEDIRRRLEQPEYINNVIMVTHQILQANTHARKMLKLASEELDKAVDDLRNALFAKTIQEPQTSFKTREVYDLIRQQYRALKKEHEDLFFEKFHLQRQIISPQRAIFMAKNIFVGGDYKRLREEIRRYKKNEQRLAPKLLVDISSFHFLATAILSDQTTNIAGTGEEPPRPNQILSSK